MRTAYVTVSCALAVLSAASSKSEAHESDVVAGLVTIVRSFGH